MNHWTFPEGELYLGDCLKIMKSLPDNSVDLIISSPPYEDARLYLEEGKNLGIAKKTEKWVSWMKKIIRESLRICKGLVAYVIGHGKHGPTRWTGSPALLMADLLREGVQLRNPAIYQREGIPGSGGPDWLKATYEWIICCTKTDRLPWANNKAMGKKWKYPIGGKLSHRTEDGKRVVKVKLPRTDEMHLTGDICKKEVLRIVPDLTTPGLIINCGAVGGGNIGSKISHENEAPFPEQIPFFFIRSFCPPDGIVCDPFVGSGTTVGVAIQTGRKFLGVDLRKSQIELTKRRIKQAKMNRGFGLDK